MYELERKEGLPGMKLKLSTLCKSVRLATKALTNSPPVVLMTTRTRGKLSDKALSPVDSTLRPAQASQLATTTTSQVTWERCTKSQKKLGIGMKGRAKMESLRQKAKQSMALWMIGMYGRKTEKIRDTLVKISEALRCIMYYYQLIATSGRRLICDEIGRS